MSQSHTLPAIYIECYSKNSKTRVDNVIADAQSECPVAICDEMETIVVTAPAGDGVVDGGGVADGGGSTGDGDGGRGPHGGRGTNGNDDSSDDQDNDNQTEPCKTSAKDLKNALTNYDQDNLNTVVQITNEYAGQFGINTKTELQHFMSQVAHESTSPVTGNRFGTFEENLNYSKERLLEKWPDVFGGANPKLNPDDYAYHPQKMAEFLYGFDGDLGNTKPGDGWKYRGRGAGMLTGRDNVTRFTQFYQTHFNSTLDFVENPSLLASNNILAVISALWFFDSRVSDNIDENTTVEEVTEIINGGTNGLTDRKNLFESITDCIA